MLLILLIIIVFSVAWFLVWYWFFRDDKSIAEVAYQSACHVFEEGDYKKAKDLLKQISVNFVPEATLKLGLSCIATGEYAEAKEHLEKVLKNSPKNFEVLTNLAIAEKALGDSDKALDLYSKASAENPQDAGCYLQMGSIYLEQDNYEKALEVLEHAKELAPDDVNILFAIAKCKNAVCDLENDEECQQLINEYNDLAGYSNLPQEFHISLAQLYAKTGDMDMAIENCRNALEANQEDIEAYILMGLIQLVKKDFVAAKNSLSIALNFRPNSLETHNIFSYLLCQQEDDCKMQQCRAKYYELIEKHLK